MAYFDETGHSADTPLVGIAGFVASRDRWTAFSTRWSQVLGRHGLQSFHASHFAQSTGEFRGWKVREDDRRQLLGDLVGEIRVLEPTPVAAFVDAEGYRNLPGLVRGRIRDPYDHCLQTVLRGAALEAWDLPRAETVEVVLADTDEFRGHAKMLWPAVKARIDLGHRLGSLAFRMASQSSCLQAADLLAYELNQEFKRQLGLKPRGRWGFQALSPLFEPAPMVRFFGTRALLEIYGR